MRNDYGNLLRDEIASFLAMTKRLSSFDFQQNVNPENGSTQTINYYNFDNCPCLVHVSNYSRKPVPEASDRGAFGDFFGAINSLFSGLAFAGIIYTILLQRSELALQREELKETRKELRRSADAQERSEKAFLNQSETMTLTARINALSTIVEYCMSQGDSPNGSIQKLRASGYIEEIQKIIVELGVRSLKEEEAKNV